ncbi:MAG TPA: hypothetical protein DCP92_25280 [Nitrospiraceae bacterium]|jgi:hypothetical protein|nr:hypothetical protein [Nitrospiraceae bacterium]
MNNSANNKKEARAERLQQKIDAGYMSAHFPDVLSIVISMTYNQRGIAKGLPRTVNFFPGSYALFKITCLSKECVDGGFDFTNIITTMIGNRKKAAKGELGCEGNGPSPDHSAITYEVAIQYA